MASHDAFSRPEGDHHKRSKSSVIRTFMHKRTQSKGEGLSPQRPNFSLDIQRKNLEDAMVFSPGDTTNPRALGELQNFQNQAPPSPPKKSKDEERSATGKSLHKKTFSTISLKSLTGRDEDKQNKFQEERPLQPKKTKSSRNLAALLSRPKSSKDLAKMRAEEEAKAAKDKENQTPSNSSSSEPTPPIYAQFSSQTFVLQPSGGKFVEDQIELYTPHQYSPSKQRNFYGGPGSQPTLTRQDDTRRPLSTSKPQLPHSFSTNEVGTELREQNPAPRQGKGQKSLQDSNAGLKSFAARASQQDRNMVSKSRPQSFIAKQNNSCSSTSTGHSQDSAASTDMDPETVEREFEAMLSRRNIPENQKAKMYSIAFSLKVDLIRQDRAEISAGSHDRPGTNSSSESKASEEEADAVEKSSKRPRSRTFTLSRAHKSSETMSSTKKSRPESSIMGHSRTKSSENVSNTSRSLTSAGAAVASTLIAKAKGQLPDDFVNYLRKAQKPELVEVGKLHKLRLLLRNETVAWTDSFIGLGGMIEIVGLLHRTMEVEWRYVSPFIRFNF